MGVRIKAATVVALSTALVATLYGGSAKAQKSPQEGDAVRAGQVCLGAVRQALQNKAINIAIQTVTFPGADRIISLYRVSDTLEEARALYRDGRAANAIFSSARVVTGVVAVIPGGELFGAIGTPALSCTEAALWYTGKKGADIGEAGRRAWKPAVDSEPTVISKPPAVDSEPTVISKPPAVDSEPTVDSEPPAVDSEPTVDSEPPAVDSEPTVSAG